MDKAVLVTRFDSQDHLWQTTDGAMRCAANLVLSTVDGSGNAGGEYNGIEAHLGDVKPGKIFLKDVSFDQQIKKVSSTHVLEHLSI